MSDLIGKQVNNILRREKRVINKIYTCDMPWVERKVKAFDVGERTMPVPGGSDPVPVGTVPDQPVPVPVPVDVCRTSVP